MKRATCRGVGAQRRPAHPLSLQHCLPNGILPGDTFSYGNGAYGLWKGLLCPPHPPRAGGGRGQARGGAGGRQGRPPGAQHGAGGGGQKPRPERSLKQFRLLSVKERDTVLRVARDYDRFGVGTTKRDTYLDYTTHNIRSESGGNTRVEEGALRYIPLTTRVGEVG